MSFSEVDVILFAPVQMYGRLVVVVRVELTLVVVRVELALVRIVAWGTCQ